MLQYVQRLLGAPHDSLISTAAIVQGLLYCLSVQVDRIARVAFSLGDTELQSC
jgi:hypothetical protein